MCEDFRFGRECRLRRRRQFLSLYRDAERVHTPFFVVYLRANSRPTSRLGITVSRKIGKPVIRNRLKRCLREIFRLSREKIQPPSDVVINVKKSAPQARFEQLRDSFLQVVDLWRQREGVR